MKIFTLGYQGLDLKTYIETLSANNVGIVLDVREVAWSYNRIYTKSNLQKSLLSSGIKYTHIRSAGNPSSNRKTATSVEDCLTKYRVYLKENSSCLETLLEYIKSFRDEGVHVCLTCFEHLPHECHRSILTEELTEIEPNLQIFHLRTQKKSIETKGLSLFSDTIAQLL
ncbi:MAG: DUF488 domain-containing protein [Acidobacteriota bacterium]|nr:DUF488 domain-containing protein [Acidobacteriota bacterium]